MDCHNSFRYANVTKFQDANHLVYAIYACLLCVESRHSTLSKYFIGASREKVNLLSTGLLLLDFHLMLFDLLQTYSTRVVDCLSHHAGK